MYLFSDSVFILKIKSQEVCYLGNREKEHPRELFHFGKEYKEEIRTHGADEGYLCEQVRKRFFREQNAKKAGAEVIVTACPLCYYNLKTQANGEIEVKYITELLADALGVKED